jgi:aliphatic sulfonates family ABC transporter substrate-binding protein
MTTRSLPARSIPAIFEDPLSRQLSTRIQRIAPSDAPVLVIGETGTGKEIVARDIHARSLRAGKPFVAVNLGALPEGLSESELFGYEKGAFTGAQQTTKGWFEAAHEGTLFLDEIGELPLALQVKLLRVLQEGEVTRLGSRRSLPVDVRIIAATNVDLDAAIRAGRFREDLLYRLKVASLRLPPLRDRPLDILPLATHFVGRYRDKVGRPDARLGQGAAARLLSHDWPGNVRELENCIHHALLVGESDEIHERDLELGNASGSADQGSPPGHEQLARFEQALIDLLGLGLPDLHGRVEAALLCTTYRYSGQNQLETARLLGLSRHVVRARLIEHGVLEGPLRRAPSAPRIVPRSRGPRSRQTVRVGYQKLGLLMLVKGYGAFDAAQAARGVPVEWIEFDGGIQMVEALQANDLDIAVLGNCPAVFAQAENVPIVYVAAEPPAPRGTALIVPGDSPIRDVASLRGKRVAVNRAAQAHYLLVEALEEAGVDRDDVDIVFASPERAFTDFSAGRIAAWAIWDPWLSWARLEFGARVLRDATNLLDNSSYYVARREFAAEDIESIQELVLQLQVAAHRAAGNPRRAAELIAPGLGLSARALHASLDRELRVVPLGPELVAAQQHVADTLFRLRLIPRAVSVADAQLRPLLTA